MTSPPDSTDVLVVGAGFAGLYAVYTLRSLGYSVIAVESGSDVGGTWFWNRYPGARCDVESLQYCYTFSEDLTRDWRWSERFSAQPEILAYLRHVADRFDLRKAFRFGTRVTRAVFCEGPDHWEIQTDQGDSVRAKFFIMATGCLSAARLPEFAGLADFQGARYHTPRWPAEEVDFTGKTVGIIGTGSSAIQCIPVIARQCEKLYVFQRTPAFSVPARNGPIDPAYQAECIAKFHERREKARKTRPGVLYDFGTRSALEVTDAERQAEYGRRWEIGGTNFMYAYTDHLKSEQANQYCADFVRNKIAEIVKDPEIAKKLMPRDYPIGAKRICTDTDYYETFNRDNVTLVDLRTSPIDRFTKTGLSTTDRTYPCDIMVFATGFDALTGAMLAVEIIGRDGLSLQKKWAEGPKTYLGLTVAGFPNLFAVATVGSPSALSNLPVSIEQHVEWIADCLAEMRRRGATTIEARLDAEADWGRHVNDVAGQLLFSKANSWFNGANIPGKPRVFLPYPGGVDAYAAKCAQIVREGYAGFIFH